MKRKPRVKGSIRTLGMLPDSIHVLAFPRIQSTDDPHFGIVVIRGVLHAFTWKFRGFNGRRGAHLHGTETRFAAAGAFGEDDTTEVVYYAGRYRCNRCCVDAGLRFASHCDHCEAAHMIDMYQWNYDG